MQPKTKEQAIEQEIRNDQAKMLLEDSFVVARHNGIEYRLINERVVKEAMEAYAQSQCGKQIPVEAFVTMLEGLKGLSDWIGQAAGYVKGNHITQMFSKAIKQVDESSTCLCDKYREALEEKSEEMCGDMYLRKGKSNQFPEV